MTIAGIDPSTHPTAPNMMAQAALKQAGHYHGAIDGWFGEQSQQALGDFMAAQRA